MRWTRAVPLTNGADADGEVVWFWRPDAGVKSARRSADDGVKQAWSPGRARRKPLKPLRGECRVISGVTVVTMLVCYFYFACEAAGALGARHSSRPLISGAKFLPKLGRIAPRDRESASGRFTATGSATADSAPHWRTRACWRAG